MLKLSIEIAKAIHCPDIINASDLFVWTADGINARNYWSVNVVVVAKRKKTLFFTTFKKRTQRRTGCVVSCERREKNQN